MADLNLEQLHKCRLIRSINDMLVDYGQPVIDDKTFDTLYNLDIEQLKGVKQTLKTRLNAMVIA